MRRKNSVGFLCFVIIIVLLFVFIYRYSYDKALSEKEELTKEITEMEECYYIKNTDGYVTVYLADEETVYEYTSIPIEELPESLQTELKEGKKVEDVGEVYGFLENYSS